MKPLYPLKFNPILKEKIWGGNKLKHVLGKQTTLTNVGESWEICDVNNNHSMVNNGDLKNKSLSYLLETYTSKLLGEKNYKTFGNKFPLLIKFIDAANDLSVQLHPNDALAKARHDSFGKTEMWYIMQADKDASLIVDFKENITKQDYLSHLEQKTLPSILNFEKAKQEDAYFIEVGRVHAICSGVLLAEIQQTSDITYRVYDWDRVDQDGNERELHINDALEAINFNMSNDYKLDYSKQENNSNLIKTCNYFTTNYLKLTSSIIKENTIDSFIIYMCTSGHATITYNNADYNINKGETILLPAIIKKYTIASKNAELLEVYV